MNKEILDKFNNTLFATQGGSCFECCDYEAMYEDLVKFIDNNFSKNQNIKKMKPGMNKVTCKKEKGDIVIRVPIDFLVSVLEEDRTDMTSIVVTNKNKFIKEFCERLLEYDHSSGYNDYGLFYRLLDEVAEEIYSDGLYCVQSAEDYYKKNKRKAVAE